MGTPEWLILAITDRHDLFSSSLPDKPKKHFKELETSEEALQLDDDLSDTLSATCSQLDLPDAKAVSLRERAVILKAASPGKWMSFAVPQGTLAYPAVFSDPGPDGYVMAPATSLNNEGMGPVSPAPQQLLELRIIETARCQLVCTLTSLIPIPNDIELELRSIFFQKDLARLQKLLSDGKLMLNSINSRGGTTTPSKSTLEDRREGLRLSNLLLSLHNLCLDEAAVLFLAEQGLRGYERQRRNPVRFRMATVHIMTLQTNITVGFDVTNTHSFHLSYSASWPSSSTEAFLCLVFSRTGRPSREPPG